MTEWEYLQTALLVLTVVSSVAFGILVLFMLWVDGYDGGDDYDPYQADDPDKRPVHPADAGWTIQVTYTARGDDGGAKQARSVYWSDAPTLEAAYADARGAFEGQNVKFGACLPGRHVRVP